MSEIHFIGSACGQAGKSWFIRAFVDIIAPSDDSLAIVDTSPNKRLGAYYSGSPALECRFTDARPYRADEILVLAERRTVIVKVPASDNADFLNWARDLAIGKLDVPCYYWFVSTGKDDYPQDVIDLFASERCFLVKNLRHAGNFQNFKQPKFDPERTVELSGIVTNQTESFSIEHSPYRIKDLLGGSELPLLTRSRLYRFLDKTAATLLPIVNRNFYRDRKLLDADLDAADLEDY